MEYILGIATLIVAFYIVIKVRNSVLTATLVETGERIISVNSKELVFDAEQRLGQKLVKAKESGKAITQAERLKLEIEFGLTKAQEEL